MFRARLYQTVHYFVLWLHPLELNLLIMYDRARCLSEMIVFKSGIVNLLSFA